MCEITLAITTSILKYPVECLIKMGLLDSYIDIYPEYKFMENVKYARYILIIG